MASKLDSLLQLAELVGDAPASPAPFKAGDEVIIRTVTHYYVGRVVSFDDRWIVLSDASWVADTGRWADALKDGTLNEVEPYPDGCAISVGAVVDVSPWESSLPRTQK
jgi:hypothetical protein